MCQACRGGMGFIQISLNRCPSDAYLGCLRVENYFLLVGTKKHSSASVTLLWARASSVQESLCSFPEMQILFRREGEKNNVDCLKMALRAGGIRGTLGVLLFPYTDCAICVLKNKSQRRLCGKWSLQFVFFSVQGHHCQPLFASASLSVFHAFSCLTQSQTILVHPTLYFLH